MRLFIATDVSEALKRAIRSQVRKLSAVLEREAGVSAGAAKWVDERNLHLTLHFLGEVKDDRVGPLIEALRAPIERQPFELAFGRLAAFPPGAPSARSRRPEPVDVARGSLSDSRRERSRTGGRVRVVWVDIVEGQEDLAAVHREIGRRLEALGFTLEAREFRPHLTLARFREPVSASVRDVLATQEVTRLPVSLVDHVTLYQSRLSPKGPTYIEVARTALAG